MIWHPLYSGKGVWTIGIHDFPILHPSWAWLQLALKYASFTFYVGWTYCPPLNYGGRDQSCANVWVILIMIIINISYLFSTPPAWWCHWRTFPPFEKYLFLIWISKCFHVNSISGCYELSCVSGQELVETASFIAMEAGHCTTSPWPRPRRMYLCQIFTDGSEVVTKLLT